MFGPMFDSMTIEQRARFEIFSQNIQEIDEKQSHLDIDDPNRILFHGTTLMAWRHIQDKGFDTHWRIGSIYWGISSVALHFAENAECDNIPVVLMAKVKDIINAGKPMPDNNYNNQIEYDSWHESLQYDGVMRLQSNGERYVIIPNIIEQIAYEPTLPLHPEAYKERANRLSCDFQCPLHPSMSYSGKEEIASWDEVNETDLGKQFNIKKKKKSKTWDMD